MSGKKVVEFKGRVLFLHGFTQSSSVFYAKTSALRKKLKALKYQAVYLNAPLKLTPSQLPSSDSLSKFNTVAAEPDEETNYRAWWFRDNNGKVTLDHAINAVRQYIEHGTIIDGSPEDQKIKADLFSENDDIGSSGEANLENFESSNKSELPPIVGIIGFSQGACLAGGLVDQFEKMFGVPLKFAVLYSGFKLDTTLMPEYKSLYTSDDGQSTNANLLHVIGELDTIVGDDRAYTLYDISKKNSHVLKHPGGHFVPNSKLLVNQVTNWIQSVDVEAERKEKQETQSIDDDLLAAFDKLGN
ncbi:hypothetical protein METBIDRAFT_46884 [Metschnikowia bicuspidata var. bicuspidata NRRL YB-4993]|uniref:Serine hydrolase domain-containing protein n=1 Tax=Metschnikowia bicuspidata var. bicuspidata NRRL YB-4993 TaxID=869754 RepID=A0A1A0H5W4_9ASCO|nr:hypothetical protein METBIDRAFT_46884 [Metschnikowia bicuspidata var. bicuspidata NRRL YB-4993]OBA19297.1 hypothetical protein METBIDRAFT_46884 [Metschnikowia bicuspidata var. bicuspidata NRRL YB-4993]